MTTNSTPLAVALYADGGVINVNPSPIGGTWAFCLVNIHGGRIAWDSGVITPDEAEMPTVSNNLTELYALVRGLEAVSPDWYGMVYSDSWVSLQRVFLSAKLKNVPQWLCERLWAIQRTGRLERMGYTLLDGHPTKAQLEAKIGKRGNPCSEHNVWCDTTCQQRAREVAR